MSAGHIHGKEKPKDCTRIFPAIRSVPNSDAGLSPHAAGRYRFSVRRERLVEISNGACGGCSRLSVTVIENVKMFFYSVMLVKTEMCDVFKKNQNCLGISPMPKYKKTRSF